MPGNKVTLIEQLILVSLLAFFFLAAAACGVGYYFTEGELADSFANYGAKAFIAFFILAMAGHFILGTLQRLFNFRL